MIATLRRSGFSPSDSPIAGSAVAMIVRVEVLHEHRAGDDQRDDELVRASGGHRPSYTSLNRKRVSTDVQLRRAARFVGRVCRERPR